MNDSTDLAVAQVAANALFTAKALEEAFSAPNCNRFDIRFLNDGTDSATLTIGSTGVIIRENETQPVAKPLATFRVDAVFLRSLADTINSLLPPAAPKVDL